MSEQYLIRVRGKVQGPFDSEKLRQLARRGQFSRLHEISVDGQQWQPAKSFPDLFAAPIPVSVAPTAVVEAPQTAAMTPQLSGPPRSETWYYGTGGNPVGPIDFLRLSALIEARHIGPDTTVWREGMADWAPAYTIPGLVPSAPTAEPTYREDSKPEHESKSGQIGVSIARVLGDSRPWIIFIAVMTFLYAVSLLALGILQLTVGGRTESMPMTAAGLGQMVSAAVVALGGFNLISYANGIARFERSRREDSLRAALASLKMLWTYVGIVLIVMLVLFVILFLILFAAIGSMPTFPSDY